MWKFLLSQLSGLSSQFQVLSSQEITSGEISVPHLQSNSALGGLDLCSQVPTKMITGILLSCPLPKESLEPSDGELLFSGKRVSLFGHWNVWSRLALSYLQILSTKFTTIALIFKATIYYRPCTYYYQHLITVHLKLSKCLTNSNIAIFF